MKRLMILIVLAFPALACAGIIGGQQTQVAAATNTAIAETAAPIQTTVASLSTETPMYQPELGTCEPPQSVRDPLVPQSALYLTDWKELPHEKSLGYETTSGKLSFEWDGEQVITIYPSEVYFDSIGDSKLLAIAPTFINDNDSVTRYGPIFFYRCGTRLLYNDDLASRSATSFPTPSG